MNSVACILRVDALVGESPVWSTKEQALYWVDTKGMTLNRFLPSNGKNEVWRMPEEIGSCALCARGGLAVALSSGLHHFDPLSQTLSALATLEAGRPELWLNDGRCDSAGRFWVGVVSSPPTVAKPGGALFSFDKDHGHTRQLEELLIPNGLAFSPDFSVMYLSDSHPSKQTIWRFDFDADAGRATNRRVFATTHDLPGRPDGAAVDCEGCYWSANVDGGCVVRFAPDGRVDRIVEMPVSKPSMCAFGGPSMDLMFVTSIRSSTAGRVEPLSGGIFCFEPGVRGQHEPEYLG